MECGHTAIVVTSQSFPLGEMTSRASVQQGSLESLSLLFTPSMPGTTACSHGWRNITHFSAPG